MEIILKYKLKTSLMKKLLMRWFPKYFNVCQHTYVDFKQFDINPDLNVRWIEPGKDNMVDALGIDENRYKELENLCEKSLQSSTDVIQCVSKLENKLHHANELCMCCFIIAHKVEKMRGPASLLKFLMERSGNGPKGE